MLKGRHRHICTLADFRFVIKAKILSIEKASTSLCSLQYNNSSGPQAVSKRKKHLRSGPGTTYSVPSPRLLVAAALQVCAALALVNRSSRAAVTNGSTRRVTASCGRVHHGQRGADSQEEGGEVCGTHPGEFRPVSKGVRWWLDEQVLRQTTLPRCVTWNTKVLYGNRESYGQQARVAQVFAH